MNYEEQIEEMDEYTYQWMPENMDDPNEPILKITKSSLGSFNWCPKKYQFSYIERRPQDQTEPMRKGTIMHNSREDFFNKFDIKKAETMNTEEIVDYCSSLFPIDDYFEDYQGIAIFEAQRFIEARTEKKLDEYLPVVNEGKFDCEIIIPADTNPKCILSRDYKIHLQGIIDRIFMEDGGLIPMEFKTGGWKDYKTTSMRQEMAFYQLMIENCSPEVLKQAGINEITPVTHWAWYYPIANHFYVEPIKKSSMKSVMNKIALLIHAYEQQQFTAKYFYKTCAHCSFFPICDKAQEDSWL
tara:strand:+ start:984 stop:1877 length:894 start_codon:yes stop_codon:yes gene_type:complete